MSNNENINIRNEFERNLFAINDVLISTLRRKDNGEYIFNDIENKWKNWQKLRK